LSYTFQLVGLILGFFAIVILTLLANVMANSKHLMQHPNKLTFMMCIGEACACWHAMIEILGAKYVVCFWGLDKIFKKTWFLSNVRDWGAINDLRKANIVLY
jgi:hypothetical protein